MRAHTRTWLAGTVGLVVLISVAAVAQRSAAPPAPAAVGGAAGATTTAQIVQAAEAVLASLDDAGRAKVQFPFEGAQRTRWSNLPTGIYERQGLRMGDLTPAQKQAVTTLLAAALSSSGYQKVTDIVRGDEYLRINGGGRGGRGGGGPIFGEAEYYLAFLGTPSTSSKWILQFGGHHLAINLTMAASEASITPSLPAAQPATFTIEGREIRPLGRETDLGLALVNSLTPAQRARGVLTYQVPNLVLGPGEDGRMIQPEGLPASELDVTQQDRLLALVREWVGIMADGYADVRMAEIRSNLAQTYFAWSGPTAPGSPSYFRIQGPTVVIEFSPQGSLDHIHTIYRDPTNDYGAKLAAR